MGVEIERKFLVKGTSFLEGVSGKKIQQGYLSNSAQKSVRVRRKGDKAYLTIKGGAQGLTRAEYEYAIPVEDAEAMLSGMCEGSIISKTRYEISHEGKIWEVDVFEGDNIGLVVAEIELTREDEGFARPDWVGAEVSDDARYLNASLSKRPYKDWA